MNYSEAIDFIHSIAWKLGSRPGLGRTRELLERLGNPERDLKFVHVAGTNGKGSTCSMLSSVLISAGYRVGLYTSPFVVKFNERMCIDGEPISNDELAELTGIVAPIAQSMEEHPTEFEIITALSFLYFKKHGCDVVVLEVGMGGRLDSTNVIESPLVSVVTGIALDHVVVLGDNVRDIAREKAGIIKNGRPVVYGGRDDDACEVISDRASELGCEFTRTKIPSINIKTMSAEGTVFDYDGLTDINLSLCGGYQPENAATVIETCRALDRVGFRVGEEALRKGLSTARWRARFELLFRNPDVVFDGSHNIQGVTAAVESAKQFFGGKVNVLMGVLADKDFPDMAEIIAPVAKTVFAITPPSPRALSAKELASLFRSMDVEALSYSTVDAGVAAAYDASKTQDVPLLILGSLYMYGEVISAFKKVEM